MRADTTTRHGAKRQAKAVQSAAAAWRLRRGRRSLSVQGEAAAPARGIWRRPCRASAKRPCRTSAERPGRRHSLGDVAVLMAKLASTIPLHSAAAAVIHGEVIGICYLKFPYEMTTHTSICEPH